MPVAASRINTPLAEPRCYFGEPQGGLIPAAF
jgi:hypothetical protein